MQESGSFQSLLDALGKERDSKMNFHEVITRSGCWWIYLLWDSLFRCLLAMLFRQFLDPRSFSFRKVAETTCMCQISWSVLQISFLTCICMCVWCAWVCTHACVGTHVCMWLHVHMYISLRLTLGVFLECFTLFLWGRISHWTQSLPVQLVWLPSLLWGHPVSAFRVLELPYSGLHPDATAPGFTWVLGLQTQGHTS